MDIENTTFRPNGGPVPFPEEDLEPVEFAILDDDGNEIEEEEVLSPPEFGSNLAEYLDDQELARLSSTLIMDVEDDLMSRREWLEAYEDGLALLGFQSEDRTVPWEGACGVFHPLMAEAVIRFQAQTIMEIFPASGPAKTKIIGKETPDKQKQGERVQDELNYFATEKMTEYRPETEKLLFNLPLAGSAFKKMYFDPLKGRPTGLFVPAEDFIAPYGASDLQSCPRYTHRMRKYPNEIRKMMVSGFYADIDITDAHPLRSETQAAKDETTGETPSVRDDRHTLYEVHVDLDLEGFSDESGIELPYVVTIDKDSGEILAIYRNWNEEDPLQQKIIHFVPYHYVPGIGFYGFGLIHLIGGIAKSSTSILRQLVDAGTLSNLPGGLKTRGMKVKNESDPIEPGEFRDVDVPAGTIRDNIAFLPYKEPSATLYQLLTNMVDEGRRLGSMADIKATDMSAQAPVGTTIALIEKAAKLITAVHARTHASMKMELKILGSIIANDMPPQYEYEQHDGQFDRRKDFGPPVSILPVSDPNASSLAQRVVQHQAAMQLAAQDPDIYNKPLLHRKMLDTLQIKDSDQLVKLPEDIRPMDPVTENMAFLTKSPVKAFLEQDHEAHLTVHMNFANDPKIKEMVGQSPNAPAIMSAVEAHIAEHLGYEYRRRMEMKMGVPLPPPGDPLPIEVEYDLSKLLASASAKVVKESAEEVEKDMAAEALKDPVLQLQLREQELKDREFEHEATVDEAKLEIERDELRLKEKKLELDARIAGAKIKKDASDSVIKEKQASGRRNPKTPS